MAATDDGFPVRALSLAYLVEEIAPRIQPHWAAWEVKIEFVLPSTKAAQVYR